VSCLLPSESRSIFRFLANQAHPLEAGSGCRIDTSTAQIRILSCKQCPVQSVCGPSIVGLLSASLALIGHFAAFRTF
jgi:hypothetical protein